MYNHLIAASDWPRSFFAPKVFLFSIIVAHEVVKHVLSVKQYIKQKVIIEVNLLLLSSTVHYDCTQCYWYSVMWLLELKISV